MKALLRCGRCWMAAAALVGVLAVGAGEVQAGTIYVSTSGNDANDGLSWATAKLTVQAGLNAAVAGDQVWVKAGTYVQCITLKAGVALYGGFAGDEKRLTQRNWITCPTILDGSNAGSVVIAPSGATTATRIDGFTIRSGRATYGAGIYCNDSSPTIANNTITGNSISYDGGGGGIYCRFSSAMITNNTITGNSAADDGGGGIYCYSSSPTIANNTIAGNSASYHGGGIRCDFSSAAITNNTITGNSAASGGGGIDCYYSSPSIANNTISGNSTAWDGSGGGGIYCRASSPTITNNTITGNGAFSGGGIHCYSSSSPTITNTIIAFNSSGVSTDGSGIPSLRYNCVYGNPGYNYSGLADATGTDGNISADPHLADVTYGNTHIQPNSPCVNAGDDSAVQPGWLDMDGQNRVTGAHVDIGADESANQTWPSGIPNVIIRVAPEGSDANDGLSWATPKRTVQAGINAASALGGEVWVKAGTYMERVTLRNFTHVFGAFAGTETGRSARSFAGNVTILDGSQSGSVVTAAGLGYGTSALDGFTIRNGRASHGGGIYCYSGSCPTITNNTITGNLATSNGGGICCSSGSYPTITNNTITGNSAAYYYGGGIYCYNASSPTITNNMITGNCAAIGGGIYACYASPTIINNTITGNSAASSGGGGIYCYQASPTIANTIIASNSSGIYLGGSGTPSLRYNCVYGNSAYEYSGLTDPTGTDGNISADPRLAAMSHGNMHLQPDSPCIDTGSDGAVQAGWLDIDGQDRILGIHVDIGADESVGTLWPSGPYMIVRVAAEGNDANDGLSWATPKRTVQAGIDTASALGGEVWVKAGTYMGCVTLRNFTHVFGGFAGTETQRSARNAASNRTVLDGNQAGSVVTAAGIGHGTSTLDGFTIRNGKALYGGGINCSNASPMITNNTITGNSAYGRYSSGGGGGGIYCSSASPTIANNTITGNSATYDGNDFYRSSGAGICCSNASPMITNNTITGNNAYGNYSGGGGIHCGYQSRPTIANNTITGNSAYGYYGSGIGGGIYSGNASAATITNNTITDNGSNAGGGIYGYYCSSTITNNTIASNSASSDGGGIYCDQFSSTITNNTITGNDAASGGGGIYCYAFSPKITNNTITGNIATFGGGGIYCYQSVPTIANTIVAFNASGVSSSGSTPILRYNCVFGNTAYNYSGLTDPTGTNGNISVDPRFVRAASPGTDSTWGTSDDDYGVLRLLPGSPCIDAGNNADVPADTADLDGDGNTTEPLPIDLAGAPRFADDPYAADTGSGTAPIVDVGAYEYRCGDTNGDGYVDVVDLLGVVYAFGTYAGDATYDATCDFNADGTVDVVDLLDIVYSFGT